MLRFSRGAGVVFEGATQRIKPVVELPTSRAIRIPFKIFQIGFNKCGTKTLHHYFSRNGVRSVHWDYGRLAQRMFANLASGSKLLAGYEQFDVFTDMEYLNESGTYLEAYKLYRHLADQYPHSVFILNTRNREAWIRSRLGHGHRLLQHVGDVSALHRRAARRLVAGLGTRQEGPRGLLARLRPGRRWCRYRWCERRGV